MKSISVVGARPNFMKIAPFIVLILKPSLLRRVIRMYQNGNNALRAFNLGLRP